MKNIKKNKYKNKDKKILLLVLSFGFVLILLGIFGYFLSKNQKNNVVVLKNEEKPILQTTIEPTKVQSKPEPTRVLSKIDKTFQVGTRTLTLNYNSKTKTTALSFKENETDVLINQWESFVDRIEGSVYRNIPHDFQISSDNNYLSYLLCSEWEGCVSEFYNFPNKKVIRQTFTGDSGVGFTKDNQYYYACAQDSYLDGGVFVYRLPNMEIVYQKPNGLMECKYNSQNNTLSIDYSDNTGTDAVYSFYSNKIISQ